MNLAAVLAAPLARDRHDCPFCRRPDAAAYRAPFLGIGDGRVVCSECGASGPGVAARGPGAREAAAAAWFAAAPRTVRDPQTRRFARCPPAAELVAAARDAVRWAAFGARPAVPDLVAPAHARVEAAESDAPGRNGP